MFKKFDIVLKQNWLQKWCNVTKSSQSMRRSYFLWVRSFVARKDIEVGLLHLLGNSFSEDQKTPKPLGTPWKTTNFNNMWDSTGQDIGSWRKRKNYFNFKDFVFSRDKHGRYTYPALMCYFILKTTTNQK